MTRSLKLFFTFCEVFHLVTYLIIAVEYVRCAESETNATRIIPEAGMTTIPFLLRSPVNFNQTNTNCPENCSCSMSVDEYRVTCLDRRFLPTNLPLAAKYLSYTKSTLPKNKLTQSILMPFVNLSTLILSDNLISWIDWDAFIGMKHLKSLSLNNNPIVSPRLKEYEFLNPLRCSLEYLSLINILSPEPRTSPYLLWGIFSESQSNGHIQSQFNQHNETKSAICWQFRSLHTLHLDKNRLDNINVGKITKFGILKNLEFLGLSNNFLVSENLLTLLLAIKNSRGSMYDSSLQNTNSDNVIRNTSLLEKTFKVEKHFIKLNFSHNRIKKLSKVFLNLFSDNTQPSSSTRNSSISVSFGNLNNTQVHVELKNNPINCTCKVKPLMDFVYDGIGKAVISDWQLLTCGSPSSMQGINLQKLTVFPYNEQYCEDPSLSTTQVVFIVICSVTLFGVTVAVLYLNRFKIIRSCSWIEKCRETDEHHQASVRWRNNLDKYTVPLDHKGVGHRGYFREEENSFINDRSNNTSKAVGDTRQPGIYPTAESRSYISKT